MTDVLQAFVLSVAVLVSQSAWVLGAAKNVEKRRTRRGDDSAQSLTTTE